MNRPNGQRCLAKAIIDHISLWWFNTNAHSNETALNSGWHLQSGASCDVWIVGTVMSGIVHCTFSLRVTSVIWVYSHIYSTGQGIRSGNQESVRQDRDGAAAARTAWESYSNMSSMGLHRHYRKFWGAPRPLNSRGGHRKINVRRHN